MSKFVTVAQPYAEATFDFAVKHQNIDYWQGMLMFVSEVTKNEQMIKLLSSSLSPKKLADLFIEICKEQLNQDGQKLIRVMAENGHLNVLSDVFDQFVFLRAKNESITEIKVISSNALSETQLVKISTFMEKRLSSKVKLNFKIDRSMIAGVIIRAGDMVIDNSIRGRLDRFSDILLRS